MGASVYGVGASVYGSLVIIVSAQVLLFLTLGLWTLGLRTRVLGFSRGRVTYSEYLSWHVANTFNRTIQKLTKSSHIRIRTFEETTENGQGTDIRKMVTPDTDSSIECSECVMCWYSVVELEYIASFVVRAWL